MIFGDLKDQNDFDSDFEGQEYYIGGEKRCFCLFIYYYKK